MSAPTAMVAGVSKPERDDKRRDRYQRAMAAGAGATIGVIIGGPAGAVVGAALGPVLEPWAARLWEELGADGRQRVGETLVATCEALECEPEELGERIMESERTRLQAGIAISAATKTVWPAKVRVLGRALASGLLAEDEATVDVEMLILAAMADVEAPDLSLLELLACRVPPQAAGEAEIAHPRLNMYDVVLPRHGWTQAEVGLYRSRLKPVLPSLLGTLQRHGLIMQDDNMVEAMVRMSEAMEQQAAWQQHINGGSLKGVPVSLSSAGVGNPAPQSWSVTDLGELVLERYREAGADLPDGWAPTRPTASGIS
jgi:hypothetical protein